MQRANLFFVIIHIGSLPVIFITSQVNKNTAESIMKLPNIMRYVTGETPEDFLSLQKEVDCLDDFIDLQKLRIDSKVV